MTYFEISIIVLAALFFILGLPEVTARTSRKLGGSKDAVPIINIISKARSISVILLCVLGAHILTRSETPPADSLPTPIPTIIQTREYQFDQCKTCDNNSCTDSRIYSRIIVDRIGKKYSLFSISPNGVEVKNQSSIAETCQFNDAEDDPFSFTCRNSLRYGKSNGTYTIRLGHQRLTIEKEYPVNGQTEYFHSSTTCPVISTWM